MAGDIIYITSSNKTEDINNIMNIVRKMEVDDFLIADGFGRDKNVRLTLVLDDDHDIRFYVEPWYEPDGCYIDDWDGSEFYQMTDDPNAEENLQSDLEKVWEDSGREILEELLDEREV